MLLGILISAIVTAFVMGVLVQKGVINLKSDNHSSLKRMVSRVRHDFKEIESNMLDGYEKGLHSKFDKNQK